MGGQIVPPAIKFVDNPANHWHHDGIVLVGQVVWLEHDTPQVREMSCGAVQLYCTGDTVLVSLR